MDTRILTLFDDDDFLPEEKPALDKPVHEEATPQLVSEEENKAEDGAEELNNLLLSELVQQDYTAMLHKDFPFDISAAEVVKKEMKVAPMPPATEPEVEDEAALEAEGNLDSEPAEEAVAPLPEWNLDKNYYTIGEVAQMFAVNNSHIRFWTKEFRLKPRTTRKGDRLYSPEDVAELRLIHHLVKEKKHTIKGAREKLQAGKKNVSGKLDLKQSLMALKERLVQLKEQL